MNDAGGSRFAGFQHRAASWWAVPLRLIVGYGFIAHGVAKLSRGPDAFAATLHALGVPAPDVMAWATILVEVFGGLAVLLGAFVPLASVPLAAVMLVAMFTVHLPYGFSSIKLVAVTGGAPQFGPPGYEVTLLYLASLLALVLGGPGPLSIDALRLPRRGTYRRGTSIGLAIFIGLAAASAAAQGPARPADTPARPRVKAVAFDYLALFDPTSVATAAEQAFPGRGRELTRLWQTRQFEYTWLRSITGRYVDFFAVTGDALVYAAKAMELDLTAEAKHRLLNAYLHLAPWPDTAETLQRLRQSGIRVVALANFSPRMLQANAENAGLTRYFDALLSTDEKRTYKPDPRAYRLGIEHLHLSEREILFVAFGGWDAAGAKAFGYPTVWVNRLHQPLEELGTPPDRISPDLSGVLDFVLGGVPAATAER